jgi:hypothetical protein
MHLSAHWVFPFGHRRINAWLATPRRFSQPPTSFIASWHLGIHRTPLVAYLPKSLVHTPTSRRVLSKLETKVQAQGSSPYGPQLLTAVLHVCPLAPPPRGTSTARLEGALRTPLRWVRGLRELLLSAEIEFYPSYALVKELGAATARQSMVWSWTGSNRRHPACKAGALPTELQPRKPGTA